MMCYTNCILKSIINVFEVHLRLGVRISVTEDDPLTETDVPLVYLRNSNPWHMYSTHHREEKEGGSCTRRHGAGTINRKSKQEGNIRCVHTVLWAGGGEETEEILKGESQE